MGHALRLHPRNINQALGWLLAAVMGPLLLGAFILLVVQWRHEEHLAEQHVEALAKAHNSRLPKPPVLIALTGWGLAQDRDRATAAGFDAHLTKPADPEKIISLLKDLMQLDEPRVSASAAGGSTIANARPAVRHDRAE